MKSVQDWRTQDFKARITKYEEEWKEEDLDLYKRFTYFCKGANIFTDEDFNSIKEYLRDNKANEDLSAVLKAQVMRGMAGSYTISKKDGVKRLWQNRVVDFYAKYVEESFIDSAQLGNRTSYYL